MSRFKNEFAKIDALAPAASTDTQTVKALLALIGFLALLWWWRSGPLPQEQAAPTAPPAVGTLSRWIVADAPVPACRQAACAYAAVPPVSQMPTARVLARYQIPPTEQLNAPEGYVFMPALHSGPVHTRYRHHQNRVAFALPVLFPVERGAHPALSDVVNFPADYPGYVRFSPAAAGSTPGAARQLTFQPFDSSFQVQLDEPPPYPVARGDTLAVRFLGGLESGEADLAPLASGALESARVDAVQTDPDRRRWRLNLEMTDEQALKILDQRMTIAQLSESAVFSTQVVLEFHLKQETGARQAMRLPATALTRQGAQSRVWLALDGAAVPVAVSELQRIGATVLVAEADGARGLPIARPDWIALGATLRRNVLRTAASAPAGGNKLLTLSAAVIVRPDAALRPGTPVNVRHD